MKFKLFNGKPAMHMNVSNGIEQPREGETEIEREEKEGETCSGLRFSLERVAEWAAREQCRLQESRLTGSAPGRTADVALHITASFGCVEMRVMTGSGPESGGCQRLGNGAVSRDGGKCESTLLLTASCARCYKRDGHGIARTAALESSNAAVALASLANGHHNEEHEHK